MVTWRHTSPPCLEDMDNIEITPFDTNFQAAALHPSFLVISTEIKKIAKTDVLWAKWGLQVLLSILSWLFPAGIETFNKLRLLDVSFNCIASLAELTPLAHLHNLISVSTIVVGCLESFVFVLVQKCPWSRDQFSFSRWMSFVGRRPSPLTFTGLRFGDTMSISATQRCNSHCCESSRVTSPLWNYPSRPSFPYSWSFSV